MFGLKPWNMDAAIANKAASLRTVVKLQPLYSNGPVGLARKYSFVVEGLGTIKGREQPCTILSYKNFQEPSGIKDNRKSNTGCKLDLSHALISRLNLRTPSMHGSCMTASSEWYTQTGLCSLSHNA